MPIRAILFDLDNTLLMEDEATERALRQTSELAGQRTGAEPVVVHAAAREAAETLFRSAQVFAYADEVGIWWGEALWGEFAGDQGRLRAVRAFVPGFRREVWRRALAVAGIADDALADELGAAYPTFRRALRPVDPEADAVLADLGRDHALALVTNGAPDVQREKLAPTTLAAHFKVIVISAELGIGKPDPRIFRSALDAVDVPSGDAVVVGDSLERDIEGARRAGIRSVWIDRAGTGTGGDARIEKLSELRDAIVGLERVGAFPQPA
ncbi:MAG TPA: HAD family hydrolase [Candidatus Limnocylindria bacterium]